MKRKISDMMDGYSAPELEMEHSAPLSSERIKELTMSKINHNEKKGKRITFRILVAAAVIATLAVTAVAAEEVFGAGDWFRDILNVQLEEDMERAQKDLGQVKGDLEQKQETYLALRETISEGQIEVVNELGKVFEEESQTSEGTTVTMHAAYGEAHILHLYFSVEAPEGTVLPDDIEYAFYDANRVRSEEEGRYVPLTAGEDAPYNTISQQIYIETLPDENPGDNKKDFHVTINGQARTECEFNDGYSKYFNIEGIYQQVPNVDGDRDGYELLAPGEFSFDVGLTGEAQYIQLKEAEGFTYGGAKTRTWTHDSPCLNPCEENLIGENDPETGLPIHGKSWEYEVTVKKLAISSMGVDWEVEYWVSDEQFSYGIEYKVVMKDGTSPMGGIGGSSSDTPPYMNNGIGIGTGLSYFSIPIDLEEVDYILIGDEELGETIKVYLPE